MSKISFFMVSTNMKVWFFVCSLILFGCAGSARIDLENELNITTETSFMVVRLGGGSQYIKRLVFRKEGDEEKTQFEINVNRREGAVLAISIPPGKYYLDRIDPVFEDALSIFVPAPEELMDFKVDRVYYVGDIGWRDNKVEVTFSKEALMVASHHNPDVFEGRNAYIMNTLFGSTTLTKLKAPTLAKRRKAVESRASQ